MAMDGPEPGAPPHACPCAGGSRQGRGRGPLGPKVPIYSQLGVSSEPGLGGGCIPGPGLARPPGP